MKKIYLNNDWYFTTEYSDALLAADADLSGLEKVRIPHTVCETPFNYFSDSIYQMVSGYKRTIEIEDDWRDKHLLLTFAGAAHEATVYINGQKAARHFSGYTAFTVDMKPFLVPGAAQQVVVRLDSRESLNQPPFGKVIDYMTYGGIYRDVYLEVKNENYIEDVYAVPADIYSDVMTLKADVTLNEMAEGLTIAARLDSWTETPPAEGAEDDLQHWVFDEENVNFKTSCLTFEVPDAMLWTLELPFLYVLTVDLKKDGEVVDTYQTRVGFREAVFDADGFYLNGEKIKLRGLNRHQSWPYVGYAMPKNPQRLDAQILKYQLGCNLVRTSHYPQSQDFIDCCDEIGLLVFTEIPGWQHIGDTRWKKIAVRNVREMITQYRNHPSIILWGVRINESQDDDAFYYKTNQLAHELDLYRQTGGVRYLKKSHLYEDVYTYNDFVHRGSNQGCDPREKITTDMSKGYFISEYNGHMYPTKMFDDEPHRTEHALRHARVLNAIEENEDIAGGTGWCMFDYNTHKEFGSGDRICYHGVMDMFRNPKMAAAVYQSQAEDVPVLEVGCSMNIGEYPASLLSDIYVFTNADSVKVYKNDEFIGEFYPDDENFGAMIHPPVVIDDLIGDKLVTAEGMSEAAAAQLKAIYKMIRAENFEPGPATKARAAAFLAAHRMSLDEAIGLISKYTNSWGDRSVIWRFDGIKDDQVVSSVTRDPDAALSLMINVDRQELVDDYSYDVATVHFEAVDAYGGHLSYVNEPVMLKTEGPIELIGPAMTCLRGGFGGTYVKTTGESGTGRLIIESSLGEAAVEFTVTVSHE